MKGRGQMFIVKSIEIHQNLYCFAFLLSIHCLASNHIEISVLKSIIQDSRGGYAGPKTGSKREMLDSNTLSLDPSVVTNPEQAQIRELRGAGVFGPSSETLSYREV